MTLDCLLAITQCIIKSRSQLTWHMSIYVYYLKSNRLGIMSFLSCVAVKVKHCETPSCLPSPVTTKYNKSNSSLLQRAHAHDWLCVQNILIASEIFRTLLVLTDKSNYHSLGSSKRNLSAACQDEKLTNKIILPWNKINREEDENILYKQ